MQPLWNPVGCCIRAARFVYISSDFLVRCGRHFFGHQHLDCRVACQTYTWLVASLSQGSFEVVHCAHSQDRPSACIEKEDNRFRAPLFQWNIVRLPSQTCFKTLVYSFE